VEFPSVTVCDEGEAEMEKSAVVGCGMIWIPFTGARFVPSDAVLGIAVSVKPVALMVNFT
jgi:hypothetical protein